MAGWDDRRCDELARAVLAGDAGAGRLLVEHLWPAWLAVLRGHRSMGPLARSEDHVREVATRLLTKLSVDSPRTLGQYVAWAGANPDKTFGDWMRIVLANTVRDYAREQLGARPASEELPSAKRLLNELALSPGAAEHGFRPPVTLQQTVRELVEYARSHLDRERLTALARWLEGESFADIERELGVASGQGHRLVRAGVAILRRRFGVADEFGDLPRDGSD